MEYSPVTAKRSKGHRSSKQASSARRKQRSESPRTTLRRKSARTEDKSSHRRSVKRSAEPRRSTNTRSALDASENSSISKNRIKMSSTSSDSKRQVSASTNSRKRTDIQPYPKFMRKAKRQQEIQAFSHSHVASISQDLSKEDLVLYIVLTQAARMIQKAFRTYIARKRHRLEREAIRREILGDVDRNSQQRRKDRSSSDQKVRSSGP